MSLTPQHVNKEIIRIFGQDITKKHCSLHSVNCPVNLFEVCQIRKNNDDFWYVTEAEEEGRAVLPIEIEMRNALSRQSLQCQLGIELKIDMDDVEE